MCVRISERWENILMKAKLHPPGDSHRVNPWQNINYVPLPSTNFVSSTVRVL